MKSYTMMALLLMTATGVGAVGCGSTSHIVTPLTPQSHFRPDGVVYALPRTVVIADVSVTRIERLQPGELWPALEKEWRACPQGRPDDDYAGPISRRLELTVKKLRERVSEPTVQYVIGDVTLKARTEADTEALYFVRLTGNGHTTKSLELELSEAGVFAAGSSEVTDQRAEAAVQITKVLGSLVSTLAAGGTAVTTTQVLTDLDQLRAVRWKVVTAPVTAVTASGPSAYPSREYFERLLDEQKKLEETLIARFTGNYEKKTTVLSCEFVPRNDCLRQEVLWFDEARGLFSTDPALTVPPEFASARTPAAIPVVVELSVAPNQLAAIVGKAFEKTGAKERRGFTYRIPSRAKVTITVGNKVKHSSSMLVAQLGTIASLPSRIGGSSSKYSLALHAESGAIKKLTVSSTGSLGSVATAGAGGAASAQETLAKRKTAQDELTTLTHTANMYDARVKIKEAKEKLGEE